MASTETISHFMWNKCLTKDQPVPHAEEYIPVLQEESRKSLRNNAAYYTDFVADVVPILEALRN